MTNHGGPRTIGLGTELRRHRLHANMTLRQVAEQVDLSIATLSRVENGSRRISPEDVATLLCIYRVQGTERKHLLALAREQDLPGWWEFEDDGLPKTLPALISIERRAELIVFASMLRVPGMLQTPGYMHAILEDLDFPRDKRSLMIETRIKRQSLLRGSSGPRLVAVIDEAALRRPLGDASVMRDQIAHLIQVAQLPRVDVRVIPFEHGGHIGQDGGFVLLESVVTRPTVYLELPRSGMFLDTDPQLHAYRDTTSRLFPKALSSSDSVNFLRSFAPRSSTGGNKFDLGHAM
ncbi:helix-turn-helix domain-containing protein [Actinokineospora soli]|uniref:Helix-turn-helix domain-containing protein n=1 Tax=Actinokineospora soli TaxID=1048753 RepID=A0ABW2TWC9_9PSEU